MLIQKTGYPAEDELVLCTITKVQFHSVFARLDEYQNKSGMIHISEVSPGRIRNIRDYVKEDKKVICKVLRIHQENGHIDLSLRRVTEGQRRAKINETKQQQLSEKILEFVAKDLKLDPKKAIIDMNKTIAAQYNSLYEFYLAVVADNKVIADAKLDKNFEKKLLEAITSRIKEKKVNIHGTLQLSSYAADGLNAIKSSLSKGLAKGKEKTQIKYLGGGSYSVQVEAKDYKQAESVLKDVTETAIAEVQKHDGTGEFARQDSK